MPEPQITITMDLADAQCLYAAFGAALNAPAPQPASTPVQSASAQSDRLTVAQNASADELAPPSHSGGPGEVNPQMFPTAALPPTSEGHAMSDSNPFDEHPAGEPAPDAAPVSAPQAPQDAPAPAPDPEPAQTGSEPDNAPAQVDPDTASSEETADGLSG